MNKTDLIKQISDACSLTLADAETALKTTLEAISSTLKGGDKVTLVGFGTFSVNRREQREGRNPATGQSMVIPAKNVVKFKAGKLLEDEVN